MLSPWRDTPRRRAAWGALVALVIVAHLLFGATVVASVIGWNAAEEPRRIEVSLVKTMTPTAPPAAVDVVKPAAPAPRPTHAARVARAGSAPAPAASAPQDAASQASRDALVAEALALAASQAEAAASAAAPAASAAASALASASAPSSAASAQVASPAASDPVAGPPRLAFEWPPSTRLTYTLTGEHDGGNLYGTAAVEWRREAAHYQVQFDIHITPFIEQHMQSDGRIGADGLSPARYDESFKMVLMAPRIRKIEFGDDDVTLNTGQRVAKLPQTQDGASQFVQFVWMFATRPALLKTGNVVEIPLALTGSLRRWRYLVVGHESQPMPFGAIDAVHLRPLLDGPRRANEYPFEIWVAPSLQYLPVRILVKTEEHSYADLVLDALPLQAGAEPPPPRIVPPPPLPKPPAMGER